MTEIRIPKIQVHTSAVDHSVIKRFLDLTQDIDLGSTLDFSIFIDRVLETHTEGISQTFLGTAVKTHVHLLSIILQALITNFK